MKQDYYKLLGLRPDASAADIRHAHRRLSRRLTKRADQGDSRAKAELTHVGDAYATLSDDARRRQYDMAIADARGVRPQLNASSVTDLVMRRRLASADVETKTTGSIPGARSEDLDWSSWHQRRFSLRPGEMPLPAAVVAAFILDALYILLVLSAPGGDDVNRIVTRLSFLISVIFLPLAAVLRGRHWFLWGVIGFAAGTTLPLVFFGRPMSHVAFAALLLARQGKPRCPHCGKRVERHTSQCSRCQVDLRAQPAGR